MSAASRLSLLSPDLGAGCQPWITIHTSVLCRCCPLVAMIAVVHGSCVDDALEKCHVQVAKEASSRLVLVIWLALPGRLHGGFVR